MPSTEVQLELQAKYIDVSVVLQPCGLPTDLGSPAVSQTAVYANGLKKGGQLIQLSILHGVLKYVLLLATHQL